MDIAVLGLAVRWKDDRVEVEADTKQQSNVCDNSELGPGRGDEGPRGRGEGGLPRGGSPGDSAGVSAPGARSGSGSSGVRPRSSACRLWCCSRLSHPGGGSWSALRVGLGRALS